MQLNVLGVHDLALAVLPGMVEREAGGILISGSAAGNSPIPNNATYAATKAFVNTFSESLRGELKRAGVHVTLLAPGPVRETLPDAHEQSLVEKLIPDFLWISTEYTAKLSLDGLERNKMRVVPGRHVEGDVGGIGLHAAVHRDADRRRGLQETRRRLARCAPKLYASRESLTSKGLLECRFAASGAAAAGAEDAAGDLAADDGARRAHCALERRALHHLLEHSWLGASPRLHLTLGAGLACVDGHWRRQRSVSGAGGATFACRIS